MVKVDHQDKKGKVSLSSLRNNYFFNYLNFQIFICLLNFFFSNQTIHGLNLPSHIKTGWITSLYHKVLIFKLCYSTSLSSTQAFLCWQILYLMTKGVPWGKTNPLVSNKICLKLTAWKPKILCFFFFYSSILFWINFK